MDVNFNGSLWCIIYLNCIGKKNVQLKFLLKALNSLLYFVRLIFEPGSRFQPQLAPPLPNLVCMPNRDCPSPSIHIYMLYPPWSAMIYQRFNQNIAIIFQLKAGVLPCSAQPL